MELNSPKIQIHKTSPSDLQPFFSNHCVLINLFLAGDARLRIDKNTISISPAVDVSLVRIYDRLKIDNCQLAEKIILTLLIGAHHRLF